MLSTMVNFAICLFFIYYVPKSLENIFLLNWLAEMVNFTTNISSMVKKQKQKTKLEIRVSFESS